MESQEQYESHEKTERAPTCLAFSWIPEELEHTCKKGIQLSSDPRGIHAYVVYQDPLPEMPADMRSQFKPYTTQLGAQVYYCGLGGFDLEKACTITPRQKPSLTHGKTAQNYGEAVNMVEASFEDVGEIFKAGRVLVYTGAGISVEAGTPDLLGLQQHLGIENKEKVDDFVETTVLHPERMMQKIFELQKLFLEGTTLAHIALTKLQELYGFDIATENLDKLHEAAGTKPIKIGEIDTVFTDEKLLDIEVVVTVGLRSDNSGLLYRYRELNPNGRFVALNIAPPPYMTATDLYLRGDVATNITRNTEILY